MKIESLHTVFSNGKARFSLKIAGATGTVNFRDLATSRTGTKVTPAQSKLLEKASAKISAILANLVLPASPPPVKAQARSPKTAPAKKAPAKKK